MHRRHPIRVAARAVAARAWFALALGAAFAAPLCVFAPQVSAQTLPREVVDARLPLRESGSGRFRYFGFHVYDARLWVSGERYSPEGAFALGLKYAREFKGEAIAQSSTDEMRRLKLASEDRLRRWDAEMRRIFPLVGKGDEILGLHWPGRGVQFFLNGRPIGEIAEPEFAAAFFGIWLDPRTRGSDLRLALLGERVQ